MDLTLLHHKYINDSICYKLVYLDKPYYSNEHRWIDNEVVIDNLIIKLEQTVFEEILLPILSTFSFFDPYEISNFLGDDANKLVYLINEERLKINNLDEKGFEKKYNFIFSLVNNPENMLIAFKEKDVYLLIKNDINKLFDICIKYLNKAINEKKSFTIVGI